MTRCCASPAEPRARLPRASAPALPAAPRLSTSPLHAMQAVKYGLRQMLPRLGISCELLGAVLSHLNSTSDERVGNENERGPSTSRDT